MKVLMGLEWHEGDQMILTLNLFPNIVTEEALNLQQQIRLI